jgi:hypothetical protein
MALGALLPATASADDSIYWSNEKAMESIRFGPLTGDGGGSTPAQTLFDDGGGPCGIAADPAAGKIYGVNWFTGEIRVANVDGTGTASTLFAEPGNNVCGVAVDPGAGKIYWANFTTNEIRAGNLDGTGTASTLFTDPGGSAPSGVAIDPASNKIYWTNQFTDQIRVGNLDGSGTAQTLFGGETPSRPTIDPTTNKIYWTSFQSGSGIRVGNLDGSGTASTLFNGESASLFAALLKVPVNTAPPAISGGDEVGGELTCQNGTWASDLLASFLFRAPASFALQWQRNGSNIATGPTFMADVPGDYTCTVTATNHGGSTSATSAVKTVSPPVPPAPPSPPIPQGATAARPVVAAPNFTG